MAADLSNTSFFGWFLASSTFYSYPLEQCIKNMKQYENKRNNDLNWYRPCFGSLGSGMSVSAQSRHPVGWLGRLTRQSILTQCIDMEGLELSYCWIQDLKLELELEIWTWTWYLNLNLNLKLGVVYPHLQPQMTWISFPVKVGHVIARIQNKGKRKRKRRNKTKVRRKSRYFASGNARLHVLFVYVERGGGNSWVADSPAMPIETTPL